MIHVFIGTKAQYIKTAPLLRRMDAQSVPYRLIDSGQHGAFSQDLRTELGVRQPDHHLGEGRDVTSIPGAMRWAVRLAAGLWSGRRLRRTVFGGSGGICLVHGDTPSTLLAALMARRAGLVVGHLEAGLRSHKWFHPFPEEMIRMIVMRMATVLFAPDATAVANLEAMGVAGEVVPLEANTSAEAVAGLAAEIEPTGPAVVTMHRVENLHRRSRRDGFVELVTRLATDRPVRFVAHEPTIQALSHEALASIEAAGVVVSRLLPHRDFVDLLAAAPLVVTDGGSIQEECALLGVPTLLWRDRSERPDGIGANVVVSHYDPAIVDEFVANPDAWRRPAALAPVSPSAQILDRLGEWVSPR